MGKLSVWVAETLLPFIAAAVLATIIVSGIGAIACGYLIDRKNRKEAIEFVYKERS